MNMKKILLIILTLEMVYTLTSCDVIDIIRHPKFYYREWKHNQRTEAYYRYELPPLDQLIYKVDTLHLENPVIVADNYNIWIIDAYKRPLDDKLIESYLTDSVRYISPFLNLYPPYPYGSKRFNNQFIEPDGLCDCDIILRPEESSKKYRVFDYANLPEGFALFLVNARYYAERTGGPDTEFRIDHIVNNYTMSYIPILFPLGCCDYHKRKDKEE